MAVLPLLAKLFGGTEVLLEAKVDHLLASNQTRGHRAVLPLSSLDNGRLPLASERCASKVLWGKAAFGGVELGLLNYQSLLEFLFNSTRLSAAESGGACQRSNLSSKSGIKANVGLLHLWLRSSVHDGELGSFDGYCLHCCSYLCMVLTFSLEDFELDLWVLHCPHQLLAHEVLLRLQCRLDQAQLVGKQCCIR